MERTHDTLIIITINAFCIARFATPDTIKLLNNSNRRFSRLRKAEPAKSIATAWIGIKMDFICVVVCVLVINSV